MGLYCSCHSRVYDKKDNFQNTNYETLIETDKIVKQTKNYLQKIASDEVPIDNIVAMLYMIDNPYGAASFPSPQMTVYNIE